MLFIFEMYIIILYQQKNQFQKVNINDNNVLENLNTLILTERLSKSQILKMIDLATISNDINDLKDKIEWENIYEN